MNTQRVEGLLSSCGRLLAEAGRRCKSYVINDKAEQDWAESVWTEAVAEPEAQQGHKALQRLLARTR